jgi:cob(I)alamin adenosyltransferase
VVLLNKIYTKTGDDGRTALGTGERRDKFDLRVEAYGTVDELNSVIGVARLHTKELVEIDGALLTIQNDLFDLGADLCTPEKDEPQDYEPLRIVETQVKNIENAIDKLNANLKPLRSFILPAGNAAASHLHLARTVSRRAERLVVHLSKVETVNRQATLYLNRLSDYFFVAARVAANNGEDDVLWVPGKNREQA